jgi:hypothetical protein
MNWSNESVDKVATRIFDTYAASGIAADWAKGLNWHDVLRMSWQSDAYKKVVALARSEAKAALSVISELPEMRGLVEALEYYREEEWLGGEDGRASKALAPFTAKNYPASLSPVDCPSGNGDAQTASMSSHAAPEDAQDGGVK